MNIEDIRVNKANIDKAIRDLSKNSIEKDFCDVYTLIERMDSNKFFISKEIEKKKAEFKKSISSIKESLIEKSMDRNSIEMELKQDILNLYNRFDTILSKKQIFKFRNNGFQNELFSQNVVVRKTTVNNLNQQKTIPNAVSIGRIQTPTISQIISREAIPEKNDVYAINFHDKGINKKPSIVLHIENDKEGFFITKIDFMKSMSKNLDVFTLNRNIFIELLESKIDILRLSKIIIMSDQKLSSEKYKSVYNEWLSKEKEIDLDIEKFIVSIKEFSEYMELTFDVKMEIKEYLIKNKMLSKRI